MSSEESISYGTVDNVYFPDPKDMAIIPSTEQRAEVMGRIKLEQSINSRPCDCTACGSCRCTPCK